MKYLLLLFLFLLSFATLQSQENSYILIFKDKKNSSLVEVKKSVSEKTQIKRKQQNIPFDFYDLSVSETYLNKIRRENTIKSSSKWLNAALIYSRFSTNEIKKKYPFVNEVITLNPKPKQKHLASLKTNTNRAADSNLYNFSFNQLELTNTASCLHDNEKKGDGITIAVLDAGFPNLDAMTSFSRLRNENRIIDTWDFEDNLPFVYHKHTHGTFVSSIIVGEIDSTFIGSAPDATFAFYITEIGAIEINQEEYNLVLGLERADSIGADIASISLGYRDFDTLQTSYGYTGMDGQTTIASQGVKIARDKGMILVIAAGNEGNNGIGSLSSPCDVDSILCVGATNYDSTIATFSSQGPTFDNRIKPDVSTLGDSCYFIQTNDTVNSGNGTSFATPLMSGMIACIKQNHPLRTNYEIMDAVRLSGHKNQNPDNIFGWGIPNSCAIDSTLTHLDSTAGIHEIKKLEAQIYPNPTHDRINIKTKHLLKNIRVFNSIGETVTNKTIDRYLNNYEIELSNLKKGTYFVEIISIDGFKITKQIFKL